jgi:CheY-like chemotaxis protein
VSAHRPRVVLLDMRMPVLDGWGFKREMKLRLGPVQVFQQAVVFWELAA